MEVNKKIYILLILIWGLSFKVYATELILEERTNETENFNAANVYRFKVTNWTSKGQAFYSYDVSENGEIVITFTNNKIGVFDENMNCLYELSFTNTGAIKSTYGAMWYGENILFIDSRSDTAIEFDKKGLRSHIYTITNSDKYFNKIVKKRSRSQGNYKYYCTNKSTNSKVMDAQYYTILKRTSQKGETEILYQTNKAIDGGDYNILTLIMLFSILFITIKIFKYSINNLKNNIQNEKK